MSKAAQTQLLGTPSDDAAHIETNGRTLRPATSLLTPLVDELKLDVTDDGLHSRYIDPANVALGDVTIYSEAFDTYDVDADLTLALNISLVSSPIQQARMARGNTDDVTLKLDERRTQIGIEREYAGHDVELTDELLNIDPDSIREKPNVPPLEEYHSWSATVDPKALHDVVSHFDADHVVIAERDGRLILGSKASDGLHDGEFASVGDFGDITTELTGAEAGARSTLSMDYLRDIVGALKQAKVTDLSIRWGDEAPVTFEYERVFEDSTLYEGEFVISPRIESEDD